MANSNMTTNNQNQTNEFGIYMREMIRAGIITENLQNIFKPIELTIYIIGVTGNFLALITLIRSKKMRTPSFSYHRALITADFIYCLNFLINAMIEQWLIVACRKKVFRYWFAAFLNGALLVVIRSICSYVLLYITMVIAMDRVLALLFATGYYKWNRPLVAKLVITLTILISIFFHSWSTFIDKEIHEFRYNDTTNSTLQNFHPDVEAKRQLLIDKPCWNDSVVYFTIQKHLDFKLEQALRAKEFYNGAMRISYSIILTLLTLCVIGGLIRRRRRRDAGRSIVSLVNQPSEATSVCVVDRKRKGSNESSASRASENARQRKTRGCERVLFLLMIAVLLLAFFQVAASETYRIFSYLYPTETLYFFTFANPTATKEEKLCI